MENNNNRKYYDDDVPAEERNDVEDEEVKQFARGILEQFEQEKAAGKTVEDIELGEILEQQMDELKMYNDNHCNTTQMQMFGSEEHNTISFTFADRQGYIADEIISSDTPPEITDRLEYYNDMEPLSAEFVREENGLPLYCYPAHRYPSHNWDDERSDIVSPESANGSEFLSGSGSNDQMGIGSEQGTELERGSDSEQQALERDNNNNSSSMDESKAPSSEQVESKAEQSTTSSKRKRDDDTDEDNTSSGPRKRVDLEDYLMDPGSDLFDLSGE